MMLAVPLGKWISATKLTNAKRIRRCSRWLAGYVDTINLALVAKQFFDENVYSTCAENLRRSESFTLSNRILVILLLLYGIVDKKFMMLQTAGQNFWLALI